MFTHSYSLDSVQNGSTALLVAAEKGHCSVVRMLLEAKADVNIRNNVSERCSSDGVCALALIVLFGCINNHLCIIMCGCLLYRRTQQL